MREPSHKKRMLLALVLSIISIVFLAGCENIQGIVGLGEEITIEQAGLLVYEKIIQQSPDKDSLVVYIWPEKLIKGDIVFSEFGTESAFKVKGPSWFFWIDDEPGTRFAHKNRFVLVNARTSKIETAESGFWPFINEYSIWDGGPASETQDSDAEGKIITGETVRSSDNYVSLAATEGHGITASIISSDFSAVTGMDIAGLAGSKVQECPCENPKKYALVISGEHEPSNGFTADAFNMGNSLANNGYEVTTLLPQTGSAALSSVTGRDIGGLAESKVGADGGSLSSGGQATPANIREQLLIMGAKVRCCDEFVLYISTHGTRTNCGKLKALFSGSNPNGVPLETMTSIANEKGTSITGNDIAGLAGSKVDQSELCLKMDPPLRVKYSLQGYTTRDIAGLAAGNTGIKYTTPSEQERLIGNPDGGFIGMGDLNDMLDGLTGCSNANIIIDSCYSGAAADALAAPGRTIMTATDGGSTAEGTMLGGFFTNALLSGLDSGQGLNEAFNNIDQVSQSVGLSAVTGKDIAGLGGSNVVNSQKPQYSTTPFGRPCCPNDAFLQTTGDPALTADQTTTIIKKDTSTGCVGDWVCGAFGDLSWGPCVNGVKTGTRTRACSDKNRCGTITNRPELSETTTESCSDIVAPCTESWSCGSFGSWSTCSGGTQSRTKTCTDANNCGTTDDKPDTSESQSCTDAPAGPPYHEKEIFLENIAGGTTSVSAGQTKNFNLAAGESIVYLLNIDPSKTYEQKVMATTGVYTSTQQRYGPPQLTYVDTAPGTFTYTGGPDTTAFGDQQKVSITIGPADSATTGTLTISLK